jgi:hypothetical protein
VAEHGSDRPVLVHRREELLLAQALHEGAKALALPRVLLDVRAALRHDSSTIPPAGARENVRIADYAA